MVIPEEDIRDIIARVSKRSQAIPGYIASAIMMLFVNHGEQTNLVYIRRTKGPTLHSGHMAFPGGKIEPGDTSSYAAAAREAYEEIGVGESFYTYLGDMGFFETLTSAHDAAAHIGYCHTSPSFRKNKFEVAEIYEIPIQRLLQQFRPDLDFNNEHEVMWLNFNYTPAGSSDVVNLWGLTARITHHFLHGLYLFLNEK